MEGGSSSMVVNVNEEEEEEDLTMIMDLPPGFRFHPTDEEIITHYLTKKVMDDRFTPIAIAHVDINNSEPWDLPKKSKMKEKEWYFFCKRDRKYPTGIRTNRATGRGYWKATGKDREIYKGKNVIVGMKKTLVFYKGRAPKGDKTNWVMHEFRLQGTIPYYKGPKDEWVVCKIFHKNTGISRNLFTDSSKNEYFIEEILGSPSSLPPLMDDNSFTASFNNYNNSSSNLQIQENQNSFFFPNSLFSESFKASYKVLNPIQENGVFWNNYQEYCPENSSVSAAANRNSTTMISPSQDHTEISSNKGFEDLEGISVNHKMLDLESLWDY